MRVLLLALVFISFSAVSFGQDVTFMLTHGTRRKWTSVEKTNTPNTTSNMTLFFDGNHKKEATLRYFQLCIEKANPETIFIFDDIYWSLEMIEAWMEIKNHPQITLALDVFQFGICFFRKEKLAKEEFVLRY